MPEGWCARSKKSGIQECYLRWDQTMAFFFLAFFLSLFVCVLVCQGDRLVVWSHSLWTACAENLPNSQTFVIQEFSSRASAKLWQRRWLTHAHTFACAEWRQAGQHRWARRGKRVDVLWGNGCPLVFIFLLSTHLHSSPLLSDPFLSSSFLLFPFLASPTHSSSIYSFSFCSSPLHSCFSLISSSFLSSSSVVSSSFLHSPLLSSPMWSCSYGISLCSCVDLFGFVKSSLL